MRWCAVCKKSFEKGTGNLFTVPSDEANRRKWGEIVGKNLKPSSRICSVHFLPSSLVRVGRRISLMPNAEPLRKQMQKVECVPWDEISANDICKSSDSKKNIDAASKKSEIDVFENQKEEFSQHLVNLQKNVPAAQIKDKPIIEIPVLTQQLQEEPIIEIPIAKSISCAGFTQTNTRFCGLVEAVELSDEFRLNCFYCSEVFPLEKWKFFTNHLRDNHFEIEEGFKTCEYVSKDHDYTFKGLTPSTAEETPIETVVINSKDPLESTYGPFESVVLNSSIYYSNYENKTVSNEISTPLIDTESTNTITEKTGELSSYKKIESNSKNTFKKTALSRFLRRTNEVEEIEIEEKLEYETNSIDIVRQNPTEISFEYTSCDIVNFLLDNMKHYPILWQFDGVPFNEHFYEAVEDLCKSVNEKWSMNIDNLRMRRSINRILRFYCYLFPNESVENIDQYTSYYDKCATFLPPSVNEIAYARCSHCFICYKNDFDLKRHLLEEYKCLQWPYKCVQCKECFIETDEYEFHKCLPHYNESFRCDQCNKTFFRRNKYNQHVADFHTEEVKHKCNICDKAFKNRTYLRNHKIIHGEKKHKCHLCPNSYYVKAQLNLHLKLHRREYDFMCELCGNKFFSQSGLKQHMKKHTGEKITCNICNLKLRKSSLSRHLQLLHVAYEGTIEETLKGRHVNYRRLIKSSPFRRRRKCIGKNFDCKICKVRFDNYELVIEHTKEFHPDIPKWSCKMCIMDFSLKRSLKRHYRRKHNLELIKAQKLIEENGDFDVELAYDNEDLDKIVKTKSKWNNARISNIKRRIEAELSPDVICVVEKKIIVLKYEMK